MVFNICTNYLTKCVKSSDNWHMDVYPLLFKALQPSVFRKILRSTFPAISVNDEESCDALNLIQGTLRLMPEDRPSISAVLGHSYLNISHNEENVLFVPDLIWSVRKQIAFEDIVNESYTNDAFEESENVRQNSYQAGGMFLKRAADFYDAAKQSDFGARLSAPLKFNTDKSFIGTTAFTVSKATKDVETEQKSTALQESKNEEESFEQLGESLVQLAVGDVSADKNEEENFEQLGESLVQLAVGDVSADVVKRKDGHAFFSVPDIINRDKSSLARRTTFSVPKDYKYFETEQKSTAVQESKNEKENFEQLGESLVQLADGDVSADVVKHKDGHAFFSVPDIVNRNKSLARGRTFSVPKDYKYVETEQNSSAIEGCRIDEEDCKQIEKKFCQLIGEKLCADKRFALQASISTPFIVSIHELSPPRTSFSVPKYLKYAEMNQKSDLQSSIEEPKKEQAASKKGLRAWIAKKFRAIRSLKCNCFN